MIKKITNNLGIKLLSILLSLVLWLIVMNYEDPQTTRSFSGVEVTKRNEKVITSVNKAIEYREGENITVRVKGKRSVLDRMNTSSIKAYADLEKKSITGAVDINVELPDGVSLVEKTPNMMMINLENVITVQKEVRPKMDGRPADGYIYLDPIITPNNIEIKGPESKIRLIYSVTVPVNIAGATSDVTLYGSPNILGESNEKINAVSSGTDQVKIEVPIEKLKKINLIEKIERNVADGYELIGIKLSQDTVSVYGKESIINGISNVVISNIDLSTMTKDTELKINLETLLPEGVNIYENNDTVTVSIDVEPIEQKEILVKPSDITVKYLAPDLQFNFTTEEEIKIVVKGIQANLEKVNLDSLSPSISVAGLGQGVHKVELNFFSLLGIKEVGDRPEVEVELSQKEAQAEEEAAAGE